MKSKNPQPLSIKANMAWNIVGSGLNLACSWLISVFLIRLTTSFDAAGYYSLAMAIYSIFAPIAQYRTYVYQVSDLHSEYSNGEYLSFRFFTCSLALLLLILYTLFTGQYEALVVSILYSIYKMASLVIDVFHAVDQANKRMDFIGISNFLQGLLSLLAFIVVFHFTENLNYALVAMIGSVGLVLFAYDMPKTFQFGSFRPSFLVPKIRKLLLKCLPIVLAGMAAAAAPSLPRQLLNSLYGPEALGIYGTLFAPVALIQMGASYLYYPLIGYYSEAYEKRDLRALKKLFLITLIAIVLIGALASLAIVLFGSQVLSFLFGTKILHYLYLLQPLIICAVLTAFMWFLNDLSQAFREFKIATIGDVLSLVVSASLMLPLVSRFSLNGVTLVAICACCISITFMAIALMRKITKRFHSAATS